MAFSNPITGGQGALIRPAIKSPNYSPGVAGWTIKRDGSAEFNNLTIRGTFFGTSYILNNNGGFFYNGTPAAGNLIMSLAPNAGIDQFGNAYFGGFNVGNQQAAHFGVDTAGRVYVINSAGNRVQFTDSATGTMTIGLVTAAHWLFDVANSQFNLFDQNGILTGRFSSLTTNSNLIWLFNAASTYAALANGGLQLGPLTTPGAIPTAGDQARAFSILNFTGAQAGTSFKGFHNTADPGGDPCAIAMLSGNSALGIGNPSGPCAVVTDSLGVSAANVYASGDFVACDNLGSPLTKTVVTPGTGWSVAAGSLRSAPQCQYWRVGDILHVRGAMATTSATPSATAFTLPGAMTPAAAWNLQQDYIFQQSSAGVQKGPAHVFLSGSAVSINNLTATAIGDIINFNHTFTLGNTP